MKLDPSITLWSGYVKPFCIFGNLYFVGTVPASTHVIDTGEGLIVIDPGYPGRLPLVIENMHEVGLDEKDVKIIINTHGHIDHFGASAELAALTGAKNALGRRDREYATGEVPFSWAGKLGYPTFRTFEPDILLDDGSTLTLGNTTVTCRSAPGHTPGTMAFFFPVTDGTTTYRAAMHGGIGDNTMRREWIDWSGIGTGIRDEFIPAVLKFIDEPVDITLGNHVHNNDTVGKAERMTAECNPFVDPTEWRRLLTKRIEAVQGIIDEEKNIG